MIDKLDKSLKTLLAQEVDDLNDGNIHFEAPHGADASSSLAVNLFLYDVRENRELRDNEWQLERRSDMVKETCLGPAAEKAFAQLSEDEKRKFKQVQAWEKKRTGPLTKPWDLAPRSGVYVKSVKQSHLDSPCRPGKEVVGIKEQVCFVKHPRWVVQEAASLHMFARLCLLSKGGAR